MKKNQMTEKLIHGIFLLLGLIMVGIKAVLPYNDLSHVIRYGSLGIWFAAGAPAVMKLCFKKKGESK